MKVGDITTQTIHGGGLQSAYIAGIKHWPTRCSSVSPDNTESALRMASDDKSPAPGHAATESVFLHDRILLQHSPFCRMTMRAK